MCMVPGHSSVLVSDYLLGRCAAAGVVPTGFKLTRLVFVAHGRHLAVTGRPLICDRVCAWKTGPVMPVLYLALLPRGDGPVEGSLYGNLPAGALDGVFHTIFTKAERKIMDGPVADYAGWTDADLNALCREPGSPWDECHTGDPGAEIPDRIIRRYYESEMVPVRLSPRPS